jgi:hypothetical protein
MLLEDVILTGIVIIMGITVRTNAVLIRFSLRMDIVRIIVAGVMLKPTALVILNVQAI